MNDIYRELNIINPKEDSTDKIEEYLSQKILGHTRTSIEISPKGLFRCRVITNLDEEELNTTKSIWFPDWKEIPLENHKYGRLNDKGQNFFYSSNSLATTIRELSPKDDATILTGIFQVKNPQIKIKSQFAGIEAIIKTNQFKILQDFRYEKKVDEIIESFISEKFQEKVDESEGFKYKLTIAFSNILLKNPEIGCLIYPSVASKLYSINFGLKSEIIDKYFVCRSMYTYHVKRDQKAYTLTPLKYAKKIIVNPGGAKNYEAIWKNVSDKDKRKIKRYSL